jgi:hypothetical protein
VKKGNEIEISLVDTLYLQFKTFHLGKKFAKLTSFIDDGKSDRVYQLDIPFDNISKLQFKKL